MSRGKPDPNKKLLHDRLRTIADALYTFSEEEHSEAWHSSHIRSLADLVEVVAADSEAEIKQLKRSLGGLNSKLSQMASKISKLEEDVKEYPGEMLVLTEALDEEQARNRRLEDKLAVAELRLLRVKK